MRRETYAKPHGITIRLPAASGAAMPDGPSGNCANRKSTKSARFRPSRRPCHSHPQQKHQCLQHFGIPQPRVAPVFLFSLAKFLHHRRDLAGNLLVCEVRRCLLVNQAGLHHGLITLRKRTKRRNQVAVRQGCPSIDRPARALFASAKLSPRINCSRSYRNCSEISISGYSPARSAASIPPSASCSRACCLACKRYGQSLGQSSVISRCSPQH